ncbi:hypothetical protein GRJ2_000178700 [Grus japonensis]|uniref:Dtw domain-containing protein 2 n=1 Tax=Grus japonensis TaxID=30415 RepID=A0ABC9VWE4_GRUJA
MDNVVVDVCYRLPDQEEDTFSRQLEKASHSQAVVLMGDLNYLDICWRDNTAGHKQDRMFLECIGDNFLVHMIKESAREDALLDFLLTNKEELARGSLAAVTTRWSSGSCKKERSRSTTPRFQKSILFSLGICLEEPHGRQSWREEESGRAG